MLIGARVMEFGSLGGRDDRDHNGVVFVEICEIFVTQALFLRNRIIWPSLLNMYQGKASSSYV